MPDYLNATLEEGQLRGMSTLGLAYVGDAVYELMVRAWICSNGTSKVKKMHGEAIAVVAATAQASAAEDIIPLLSEEELSVFRRGRNARTNSVPRGATQGEYHTSTALETLFGYLYLKGEKDRINELFEVVIGVREDCAGESCR